MTLICTCQLDSSSNYASFTLFFLAQLQIGINRLPISHFTHETESPWYLHFKHSHWRKRWSRSKFTSHYTWGTNKVCECKMDAKCTWILTWHWMDRVCGHLDYFQKPPLEDRPNINRETMVFWTLMTVDLFILFYFVWRCAWIEIH